MGVLAREEHSRNHPGTQPMIFLREPEQPQTAKHGCPSVQCLPSVVPGELLGLTVVTAAQSGGGCTSPGHTGPILGLCHTGAHLQEQAPPRAPRLGRRDRCVMCSILLCPMGKTTDRDRTSDP